MLFCERRRKTPTEEEDKSMKRKGFTLIELLIVVAIIAILAAIAVPNFLEAQVRSKVSRTKNDLRTLALGMEAYRTDHTMYPPDYDSGMYGSPPGGGNWDSEWMTYAAMSTPVAYLTTIPLDLFLDRKSQSVVGKRIGYYQYNCPDGKLWNGPGWPETGTRWFMSTMGPDLQDQVLWGALMTNPADVANRVYDPTNGTRSLGDIGRSNIKCYPE
jgi:prepilin-type N-terminal cleavage/methylation domain-containing protein